ncbi:MAG: thioredoxin domain-containing protein [Candidatus Binataceae bacterium]
MYNGCAPLGRRQLKSRSRAMFAAIAVIAGALVIGVWLPTSAIAQDSGSSNDNKVVAEVGSYQITKAEVDKEIKPQVTAWENHLYQLRRQAIDKLADDYLIEQAAKKNHMTVDQYMKKQMAEKKEKPVTEKDARAYYDAHQAQIGRPFDMIKAPLLAALQRRQTQTARQEMLAKLRQGAHLKVMLAPPRLNVATGNAPSLGPKNAPITIVEFADFECPFCKRSEETLKELRQEYGGKVRLVYLDYPLSIHPYAFQAAEAGQCAEEQGKFWQYHNALYADQSKLTTKDLKAAAAKLKLNAKQFDKCLDSGKYAAAVHQDMKEGSALGVNGTPGFFINGRPLSGAQPVEAFENVINEELANQGQGQKAASASNPRKG